MTGLFTGETLPLLYQLLFVFNAKCIHRSSIYFHLVFLLDAVPLELVPLSFVISASS